MPAYTHKERVEQVEAEEMAAEDAERQAEIRKDAVELDAKTEALLDEIDGLLETDAEEFVASYKQKGGQ